MNQLVLSLAWCWVQVLIVAGLAIALAAGSMRRSPKAGAMIAWAGVVAVLVLTIIAPLPFPKWAPAKRSEPSLTITRSADSSIPEIGTPTPSPLDTSSNSPGRFEYSAELLRDLLVSLERTQSVVVSQTAAGPVVIGLLAASVLWSLARVVCGLWAIVVLYRDSRPVTDHGIADLVAELQSRMRLHRLHEVRESSALASAAVVGVWRPAVMLPVEWREWSPAEVKAVLAHELAHVYRRDSLLRLVAVVTTALQCAQPLMYWLRSQLMLAQELAADELAASAIGERRQYLQALTQLALRQDRRPINRPAQLLLPVFSGFLLRRIEMLRAKDGSPRRGRQTLLQWSAIATLVAVTVIATAIRGLAQPPNAQSDEPIRVAKANDAKARANVAVEQRQPAPLFQRPPYDPVAMAMSDRGGFIVRLGEILARPDLGDQTRALNESFIAGWKDAFPAADAPTWSLQDINYIAGDFLLTVKRMSQPTDEQHPNAVTFGTECVVFRWKKPLTGQYEVLARIPGAVEKSHGGTKYVELPVIPFLGPTKPCVSQLDAHTLLGATSEASLQRRFDRLSTEVVPPSWHKSWNAVEGGVMTLVASDSQIIRPLGGPTDDKSKKLIHDLITHARQYSIGVDWREPAGGISVVKMQLQCDTEEAAGLVRSAIQGLVDQTLNELQKVADAADEKAIIAKSYLEPLRQAKIETHQIDDGWQVEVQFSGNVDIQAIWKP